MLLRDLKYVSDSDPGYFREKYEEDFRYLDENRSVVNNPELLKRFKSLVIPPMWSDVWICKLDNGHLQATGRDAKHTKQYRYHPKYIQHKQLSKYNRLSEFGEHLPSIRKKVYSLLKERKWTKEKVIALMIVLLDEAHFRIGNPYYTKQNDSYGLSTLRRKHIAEVDQKHVVFDFKGKKGVYRHVEIENPKLAKLIKHSAELPGYELFRYYENGVYNNIYSDDVNEFLAHNEEHNFTCKDFRTWGANSVAIKMYHSARRIVEENPRKKLKTTLIKLVAAELGNTASVCEKYYLHPSIIKSIENETLEDRIYDDDFDMKSPQLNLVEKKVLEIIQS